MSAAELTDFLKSNNLILVDKNALLNVLKDANVAGVVDRRVKWIDRKTAKRKYGVSRYWLDKQSTAKGTLLRVNPGSGRTSTIKYNEQSIIDEQSRLSV